MVTRLRSDKGSFVQSPKLAFDSEEEEAEFSGIVTRVFDYTQDQAVVNDAAQGGDTPQCDYGIVGGIPPHGAQEIFFSFDNGEALTPTQLLNGTYVGDFSATSYTPATYWPPGIPVSQWCSHTAMNRTTWLTSDIVSLGFGVSTAGQVFMPVRDGVFPPQLRAVLNYGRFLIPQLAFVQGEGFVFTPA